MLLAELIAAAAAGGSGEHQEDAGGGQSTPTNDLLERIVCLFLLCTMATLLLQGGNWVGLVDVWSPLAVVEAVDSSLRLGTRLWTPLVSEHNVRRYQGGPTLYG